MTAWIEHLSRLAANGEPAVLVTVAGTRGSAPREPGARMIVTATESIGTIGGGTLEYECTRIACERLRGDAETAMRRFPLGAAMGQCCGGVVEILFETLSTRAPGWLGQLADCYRARRPAVLCTHVGGEGAAVIANDSAAGAPHGATRDDVPDDVRVAARAMLDGGERVRRTGSWLLERVSGCDLDIAVFGAGHVGSAVVRTLAAVDCNIRWIDSRRDIFPPVPVNVRTIETADPASEVAAMPVGSCYLVMTHSHPIDFDVTARVLLRGDAAYAGLIGSRSKRRRFEKRFAALGIPPEAIASLVCPIGVGGIRSKAPAAIAIAAAAEILRAHERRQAAATPVRHGNVRQLREKP